jgi:hypothetical protein
MVLIASMNLELREPGIKIKLETPYRFVARKPELLDGWGTGLQGVVWLVCRSRFLPTLWQPELGTSTT